MATLLLTGYTIILTLFWSDYGREIRKLKTGKKLLHNLNSSFAASALIMLVSLGLSIIIFVVMNLNIKLFDEKCVHIINTIVIFVVLLALFYSLQSLKDIVKNIFNLGQTAEYFDDSVEKTNNGAQKDNK